jgi:hypothetical protein
MMFVRRTRLTRAMQVNNGNTIAENTAAPISEKQIVAAIEKSIRTPSDNVYKTLMERVNNKQK